MNAFRRSLVLTALLPAVALASPQTPSTVIPARIAHSAEQFTQTGTAPAVMVIMVSDGQAVARQPSQGTA